MLLGRCSRFVDAAGGLQDLDPDTRQAIGQVKDQWSSSGKRVILLARKMLSKDETRSNDMETEVLERSRTGLVLVGLVGIVDPLRDEIAEVTRTLRSAGIRIFMVSQASIVQVVVDTDQSQVTGDFALTAQAIAIECGITSNRPDSVQNVSALSRNKIQPEVSIEYEKSD